MSNFYKNFLIVASSIITLMLGVFALITTFNCNHRELYNYSKFPKLYIIGYILVSLIVVITLASIIMYYATNSKNKKTFMIFQCVSILVSSLVFIGSTTIYLILINMGHYGFINLEILELEEYYIVDLFISIMFKPIFLLCTLMSLVSLILGLFLFKFKLKNNENVILEQSSSNTINPNETLKKEIDEMKKALELKALKDEYADLFNKLNKK